MCRWLSYIGEPISPEQFLYEERYSLITQSQSARKSKAMVNGDGFGLGWYGNRPSPGLFRDTLPAWSDENLRSLAEEITSPLFMAHVRAATGTPSNRTNCHPFRYDNKLFMHNGQVGGYLRIRRQLENLLPDALYQYRYGSTDSEILFLYLVWLMQNRTFHDSVEMMIEKVEAVMSAAGISESFRFTAVISDGTGVNAVRYATDSFVPSLYYKTVESGFLLVSEPLNDVAGQWHSIPKNGTLFINRTARDPVFKELSCNITH